MNFKRQRRKVMEYGRHNEKVLMSVSIMPRTMSDQLNVKIPSYLVITKYHKVSSIFSKPSPVSKEIASKRNMTTNRSCTQKWKPVITWDKNKSSLALATKPNRLPKRLEQTARQLFSGGSWRIEPNVSAEIAAKALTKKQSVVFG